MLLNNISRIYFAANEGGGPSPPSMGNSVTNPQPTGLNQPASTTPSPMISGLTAKQKDLEEIVSELGEQQKDLYKQLSSLFGKPEKEFGDEKKDSGPFAELKEVFQGFTDEIAEAFTPNKLLSGLTETGGALLPGAAGDAAKMSPKEKPTIADIMKLPVEYSMGYLLIYNKLDEMHKEAGEGGKKKKAGGLGGLFSGLLEGAAGLALLAVSLIVFAGALFIFAQIAPDEWMGVLSGLALFALFVIGAITIAKMLRNEVTTLLEFGIAIAILTASLLLFGAVLYVMAQIYPMLPQALITLGISVAIIALVSLLAIAGTALIVPLATFSIAVGLMSIALLLYGGALAVLALVAPLVPTALDTLTQSVTVLIQVADLASKALLLMVPLAIFGVAMGLFSVGVIAYTVALTLLGLAAPLIPRALVALQQSVDVLATVTQVVMSIGLSMVALPIFGAAMAVFSLGVIAYTLSLVLLGAAAPLIPTALSALRQSIDVLVTVAEIAAKSVLLMIPLAMFGMAMAVFGAGVIVFATAITIMAAIGPKLDLALEGIKKSITFLSEVSVLSLALIFFMPTLMTFSSGIMVFSAAIIMFIQALDLTAKLGDHIQLALSGIKDSTLMLAELSKTVSKYNEFFPALEIFGRRIRPFSEAIMKFSEALGVVSQLGDKVDSALRAISKTVLFMMSLGEASQGSNAFGMFKDRLSDLGWGFGKLSDGLSKESLKKLPELTDALQKMSQIQLGPTLDPLNKLIQDIDKVERLTTSIEKLVEASRPKGKSIFDQIGSTLANLTGGVLASTKEVGTKEVGAPGAGDTANSILAILKKWDSKMDQVKPSGTSTAATSGSTDERMEVPPFIFVGNMPYEKSSSGFAFGR